MVNKRGWTFEFTFFYAKKLTKGMLFRPSGNVNRQDLTGINVAN